MRFHYHDVRDMPLSIVLACDGRRLTQSCLALAWTLTVAMALIWMLAWRSSGGGLPSAEGVEDALALLSQPPTNLATISFWASVLTGWWLGFGYLNAPILRSAALEIARDERGKWPAEPLLYRMATAAPVLAVLIALCFAVPALLLSLPSLIGGAAGAVATLICLPIALLFALIAAAGVLLAATSAPMMPATAVVEGRDYLEALSRPAGFVLQKPFRYAAYQLAKLGVLAVAALAGAAVFALAWAIIAGCMTLVGAGDVVRGACNITMSPTGQSPLENPPAFAAASVFWASGAVLLAWWSVVAQCCDLVTYLLMRYRIEGTTFDQVMIAEERLAMLPTAEDTAKQAEHARQRFDEQQAKAE